MVAALVVGGVVAMGCRSGETVDPVPPPPEPVPGLNDYDDPAADPDTVMVDVHWDGEGEERSVVIHVSKPEGERAKMAPDEETFEELVQVFRDSKAQIAELGGMPQVRISAPDDLELEDFEAVVSPIMRAAFRAGFGTADVHYAARSR